MRTNARALLLISLAVLVCAVSGESGKHKKKNRRYEDDRSEQVYYVDQIASASAISPWTSNRIIAKTTENGRESQYVINVAPEDEVIIHDDSATDRVSDRGPTDEQTPQDFVHEALRLRKQYIQNGPKGTTAMPASSFVEFTTVKYDHFGPSKAPEREREREAEGGHVIYHSKPVPTTKAPAGPVYVAPSVAPPSAVPTYRPKHIKLKPTKPMLVHTVTPYVAIEQEQPVAVPTVGYRPKEPKIAPKPEHVSKAVHSAAPGKATPIKQQDTAASSVYVHAVRPDEASFGSSYSTHHDSGSSYQEFHKFAPVEQAAVAAPMDSQGSGSILTIHKVRPPHESFRTKHPSRQPVREEERPHREYVGKSPKPAPAVVPAPVELGRYRPTKGFVEPEEESAPKYRHEQKHYQPEVSPNPHAEYEKQVEANFFKQQQQQQQLQQQQQQQQHQQHQKQQQHLQQQQYHQQQEEHQHLHHHHHAYETVRPAKKEKPTTPPTEGPKYYPAKNYHAIETITQVQMEPEPQPADETYRPYSPIKSQHVEGPSFKPSPVKYDRDPVPVPVQKETYIYHPPKSHHVDPPKQLQPEPVTTTTYHGSKAHDTQEKHMAEVSSDFLKLATARPAKHKYADLPKPSPAPSYSKVTSYPTFQSSSAPQREPTVHQREKVTFDPYKYRPSPTPEISSAGHGFQKITSSPASYTKYIPAKIPASQEASLVSEPNGAYSGFKQAHPSGAESFAGYLPSSTPESFSAAPSQEYPKISASPTPTYTKYGGGLSSPAPPADSLYEFPHMNETPKSFSKFQEPKVYSTIDPSEQPFKTLSATIFMKPSASEESYSAPPVAAGKPIQNLTTSIAFKASPSDTTKSTKEYFSNPEVTTYYVFPNGTEVKLGDDPTKIPHEFRITAEDGSFLTSNYTTKLAEDFAMKYNWDSLHTVADGEFYMGSASDATLKALGGGSTGKFHEPIEYVVRDKKKKPLVKPLIFGKPSLKPIKTVTIYKSTHRSSDDGEGGFEPMIGVAPQMDKKSELPGGDEQFYYTNEATDEGESNPAKASKKNAVFMPAPGMVGRMPGPGMMMKFAPGPTAGGGPREPQGQPAQDMDMSAEPSKKHQYFVLYHIEDKEKKPVRQHVPQQPPAPVVPKQEIHYHYNEKESEEPEVTHEHYNYHHEETIEDSDDEIQHHYVNPNYGKYNYRPNIAHPAYQRPLRDSMAAGSETTLKVVDPDTKNGRPLEITKQEYMRHVQNAVMRYMRQLHEEGRLPVIASRDSDDTHKAFEELDLSALLGAAGGGGAGGGAPKVPKFQLTGPLRANVPSSPSHYKPMKSVPSSSTYKSTTAAPQNSVKLGKNTYTAGKPLKVAIESLQDTLSSNVDLTVKGNKQPIKPDLSAIDVGQSYLHGPTFEQSSPKEHTGPSPKTKLHFNQASHHDINSMLNAKDSSLRTGSLKGSYLEHGANQGFGSIKGGSANVGASISFGNGGGLGLGPKGMHVAEDDNKMTPEALDAPIQIINGIPITNPYNIDINTLRYMLGGLAQAQAEQQQQQQQHVTKEPTLKLKGSNWMSLPTMASPSQVFSSHIPTYQHPPSEVNNYKYNANFDASNFKIKFPKNIKPKNTAGGGSGGADAVASGSMNYASWGEPPRTPGNQGNAGHYQGGQVGNGAHHGNGNQQQNLANIGNNRPLGLQNHHHQTQQQHQQQQLQQQHQHHQQQQQQVQQQLQQHIQQQFQQQQQHLAQQHHQQQQQHQQHQQQLQQQFLRQNREFNPELFLNPTGQLFQGLLKQNAIMSKKAATSDWKPTSTAKPTTGPSKAVKIDTNLRPPPPVQVKG